jgi:hypothetical protein
VIQLLICVQSPYPPQYFKENFADGIRMLKRPQDQRLVGAPIFASGPQKRINRIGEIE